MRFNKYINKHIKLNMSYSSIREDVKRVISENTEEKRINPRNNRLMLALTLSSSFVALLLGIVLIIQTNNNHKMANSINESIADLGDVYDSKIGISKVMSIDLALSGMSDEQARTVNTKDLAVYSMSFANNLKASVEWSVDLNTEASYYSLKYIFDTSSVDVCTISKNTLSEADIEYYAYKDNVKIKKIIEQIDLAYIDVLDNDNNFLANNTEILGEESAEYISIDFRSSDEANKKYMHVEIYGSGYVLIYAFNDISSSGQASLTNKYVSLTSVDFSELYSICFTK